MKILKCFVVPNNATQQVKEKEEERQVQRAAEAFLFPETIDFEAWDAQWSSNNLGQNPRPSFY